MVKMSMLGIGVTELLVILFIILLLFGGKKLPELARSMGTALREFNTATKESDKHFEERTKEDEDREAILIAAKKLGVKTEGRSINEINQDILKIDEAKP